MDSRSTSPALRTTGGRRPRLRAAALVAGVAGTLALGQAGIASAGPVPALRHGLGGVVPTTSLAASTGLNRLAGATVAAGGKLLAAATLPPSVDLTGFAVPPGDQGQHGACASWTTAYTMAGWESNYRHHAGTPFQPMFVYNQVNHGSDVDGTTFPDNFSVLETQGDVEAGAWTQPFSDYTSQPTPAERTNAAKHVMTAHSTLFTGSGQGAGARTAIESAIADNRPVAIGIPVYDSFFYLGPASPAYGLASESGYLEGYHAVTVLGYDTTGVRIENSWGSGWGAGGFATLGWDFVERDVFEAEAAGTFAATALTPSVTALSQHVVQADGGAPLTITADRLTSVDTTSPAAVTFVSVANPSVVVNAPVTAGSSTTLTVTVPALPAAGQYRVVVTSPDGASLPNGTTDVVDALHPPLIAHPTSSIVSAAGGVLRLTGSGFGTSAAAFAAAHITATVNGVPAPLGWVDSGTLNLTVPPGKPGVLTSIVLFADSIAGPQVSGPRYVAVITASSPAAGSRRGWTTTVRGVGIGGAHGWVLLNGRGQAVRTLPVVRTARALSTARTGAVLITSATTATVRVPAMSAGTYRLAFALDQRAFPGGSLAATVAALLSFR